MAYILSKVGQSFNIPIHIYEADTEEDMNSIDIQSIPMGSKCHIINDNKWYMLNSDGKWKAMPKQVQPDWNQNDDTAADYVKNRPFYTGDPVETVLVEESTVTFTENKGLYRARFPSTFEATVGDTYKVSWDGTVYECVCVNFNGSPVIGNLSMVGAGPDTGEPFIMGIVNGKEIQIIAADTSASHTFSISGIVQEVVKIDPKYIRDMYYTGDPVETVLVEESTVSFSFSESDGIYLAEFTSTFEATVGDTYKVSWDGTVYECTCVEFNNLPPTIGNLSIVGVGSDTGEPFLVVDDGRIINIGTKDTAASHTFSISGFVSEVVKIDKKYLPDEIMTDVESIVASHNTSTDSHSDIRLLISGLTDRLNALADSDDTTLDQLSEVVAYIKSNRDLISSITTNKVSVADIVDNLTTNVSNKPLSAAQGVVIKTLIDALRNDKLDAAELTNAVNTALAQAKASGEFDGATGPTGPKGDTGATGAAGQSAYAAAQAGGYTDTEANFYTDLAAIQGLASALAAI